MQADPSGTPTAARRGPTGGLRGILWLIVTASVVTVVFALTPLDIAAARLFYAPGGVGAADRWPLATTLPWSALYRAAPWVAASLAVAGLGALGFGVMRRRPLLIAEASFVLLAVVVGPGLVINGVFKDHWQRPRPRDLVEFGGPFQYAPPLIVRGAGGKSFPCGHCSVGFLYASGWWLWRRRRPSWAYASVGAGLVAGTALGVGRMAAGGHFLSDVIWSALLALGIAHILYWYVLRIPARVAVPSQALHAAASRSRRRGTPLLAVLAALGGLGVLAALFAVPHGTLLDRTIELGSLPAAPRAFELTARAANVEIVVVDAPTGQVGIAGELHGFGLPTSQLEARVEFVATPMPMLRYRIEQRGWFTDLDGSAVVRLPANVFERIEVRLEHGNIRVTDATARHSVAAGVPALVLHTAEGSIAAPHLPDAR